MEYKIQKGLIIVSEIVKIPAERIAVLIGKNGETKSLIQKLTRTKLNIGEYIEIKGRPEDVVKAANIVKAIGRGFSPPRALNLIRPGWTIETISMKGETPSAVKRLFGRVIGRAGSTRNIIEKRTGCLISVYGWTVSVIGPEEAIGKAIMAVEQLLAGKPHSFVYKRLER